MALRAMHIVLAVVAISMNAEHVFGNQYQERPEMDMSASTGSDGEVEAGHYGDYSDWVKKYHLGKHEPFHAKELEPETHTPAQSPKAAPKVEQAHVDHPAKPAAVHNKPAKAAQAPVKVEQPKQAKQASKEKKVKQPAEAKQAKHAKKEEHAKKAKAAPSVADELESELDSLEHAPKAAASTDVQSMVKQDQKAATKQLSKSKPEANLAESRDSSVSVDSLQAALDKLEAVPTELIQFPSDHQKSLSAASDGDTMGAAYTVTQESLHLSNFPRATLKKKKAVKAFQRAIAGKHAVSKKALGESKKSPKARTHKLKKVAVKKFMSQHSKVSKMLDIEAAAALKKRHVSNGASLDVELDRLAASAATDAASLDSLDTVSLIQEGAKAQAQAQAGAQAKATVTQRAPDMMALLARKFKRKARAHHTKMMKKADSDEDKESQKEASMAMKFQQQFTSSLNKRVKEDNSEDPKTIQEAMARRVPGSKKSPLQKKANAQAMKEAKQAQKLTQQFVKYQRKKQQKQLKQQKLTVPTKKSLSSLFTQEDTTASTELGEDGTKLGGQGDNDAKEWAMKALHATKANVPSVKKVKPTRGSIGELFGLKHAKAKAHKQDEEHVTHAHKGSLLGEEDRRAVELQKQMLQSMLRKQHASQLSSNSKSETHNIAALFGKNHGPQPAAKKRLLAGQQQEFDRAKQEQEQMLQHVRTPTQQANVAEKITKKGLASIFAKDSPAKQPTRARATSQEAVLAKKMQHKFLEQSMAQGGSSDSNVEATKSNVESLFTHVGSKPQQTSSTSEASVVSHGDDAQKKLQEQMLKQTQTRSSENVGESLGNGKADNRADVEYLFRGDEHSHAKNDKFSYMSKGQRDKMQRDFVDSANHQIQLLRQMQQAESSPVAGRAEAAIQMSEHHGHGKWDEYAYQNKLRSLFGASKLKKPHKKTLRHKSAVNDFLSEVKEEDRAPTDAKLAKKMQQKYTKQTSQSKMRHMFTNMIQEETSQFNQLMAQKQQSLGTNNKNAAFLDQMRQKFGELKATVANFKGVSEDQTSPIQNEDALVQLDADRPNSLNQVEVEELPNDDKVHASMLSQVQNLFEDGN